MNAALRAKLEFIQTKYDFTTNVNILNSDDFKTLMTSNDLVSLSVALECIITLLCLGKHNDERLYGSSRYSKDRSLEIRGSQV